MSPAPSSRCMSRKASTSRPATRCSTSIPPPTRPRLRSPRARLAAAKVEFANLRESFGSNEDQIKMGEESVRLRQADFDRKKTLATSHAGTIVDQDTAAAALVQAKQILEFVKSQQETVKVKLGGGPNGKLEDFPDYMQAKAGVRRRRPQSRLRPRQGADRRRCDSGRQHRARPRRARRPGRVRRRLRQGPLGRRQPQGIRSHLTYARACPRR